MKYILPSFLFLAVFFIFRNWFSFGTIAGGDLPYYFPPMMHTTSFLSSWDISNAGMGSSLLPTLWIELYTAVTLKIFSFLSWNEYLRIAWLFPYILFSAISSYSLARFYFRNPLFNLIASFLYMCNTYALLLVGGGQMGVALSYAVAPFGLLAFENFLKEITLKNIIVFSIVFSVVLLLDIRIGYILLVLLGVRFLFEVPLLTKTKIKKYLLLFPASGLLVVGLHAFWLLPTVLTHGEAIRQFGDAYISKGAVQFFSFAKFENALGVLHPNWPENIFGLTHFMNPEFIVLPILAYGSLLFVKRFDSYNSLREKQERLFVLFLTLLGLLGVFLAKGANEPLGQIYLWLFDHIPGFIMFRDPTKWYLLIIFSYSMLIPLTLRKIAEWLQDKEFSIRLKHFHFQNVLFLLCVGYLFLLIRPVFLGQVSGTFKSNILPTEYIVLEKFLENKNNFSRTIWIPQVQSFGFRSEDHPAINAYDFYNVASISALLDKLQEKNAGNMLRDASIGYVIVPYDSQAKLFLEDRKYSEKLYINTVEKIEKLPYLHEVPGFGRIKVFSLGHVLDHFWLTGQGSVTYVRDTPAEYTVRLKNVSKEEKLIFTDSFDPFWIAQLHGKAITSNLFANVFNSFALSKNGTYDVTISYQPQEWVNMGLIISMLTVFAIFGYFAYLFVSHLEMH